MTVLRAITLLLLAGLAVVVVACGDDDDDPASTAVGPTSTADGTGSAATISADCETGDPNCSGVAETGGEVDCGNDRSEAECQQIAVDAAIAFFVEERPDTEPQLVSATYTVWTDSCLGIEDPDRTCEEVVTPGYAVTLSLNNRQITYHVDFDGNVLGP